jgi:hypothetical protein
MIKYIFPFLVFVSLAHFPIHTQDVDMDVVVMIEQNDLASFKHELDLGLDPNAGLGELNLLMIAAQIGHLEIVRALLATEGIDVQAQDENGNTALHFAAIFDHEEVLKALLYADEPVACKCKKKSHPRFLHKMQNREGRVAADFAYSKTTQEMLENPDEYIAAHPQEFREIAKWFEDACPAKAQARTLRLESFGQKVNRNYQNAKGAVVVATEKTVGAIKQAYEKTKDVTAKGYEATQKARGKVASKYDKAKEFVACRYEKAKEYTSGGYKKTKGVAAVGLEKTKEVAAAGFEKTKNAFKAAYRKVRGGN